MDNQNTTTPTLADRVRAGEPIGVGIVGLGASPTAGPRPPTCPPCAPSPATRSAA